MKNKSVTTFLFLICLSLVVFQCEDEITQEDDKAELDTLKFEIEDLANTSICNEETECKYIGFGSKPCGGPSSYLIYSTSIDTDKLEKLVLNYNQKHTDFNTKWGIISDCSVVNPPTSINCVNNSCIAVY
ncbi:hypothetical protein [uncultured Algibacter sp.]|uniref:hypothetical protein n=1 Tax=uncultured Algibacter sp. TaxID=298659 RepID=UPI002631CD49|nr:hypothetical protein [uncultured Algibacter sp.]